MPDEVKAHTPLSASPVPGVIFGIQNTSGYCPSRSWFVFLCYKAAFHHTCGICLHRNIAQMCIIIFIQNISEKNNSYQGYDNSLN